MIPDYYCTDLTAAYLEDVGAYLTKAFSRNGKIGGDSNDGRETFKRLVVYHVDLAILATVGPFVVHFANLQNPKTLNFSLFESSSTSISPLHPLENLLTSVSSCFNATYGGVRVHPRLLKHADQELESAVERIYFIVRCLFPALPPSKQWVRKVGGGGGTLV